MLINKQVHDHFVTWITLKKEAASPGGLHHSLHISASLIGWEVVNLFQGYH
jgi:hypothetical protein